MVAAAASDTGEIRRRLDDALERLLDELAPGWVKRGGKAYPWPKSNGDLGSAALHLAGPRRGLWYRHSQGVGGDAIALIAYVRSGETRTAADHATFDWARDFLGMAADWSPAAFEDDRRRRAEAARQREIARERAEARERARGRARVRDVWRAGLDPHGTPVERWLAGRGVPVRRFPGARIPPSIRFLPDLPYWDGGAVIHRGPAMVAGAQDALTGRVGAVHVTWLSDDGSGKAALAAAAGTPLPARKIRGRVQGAHVRFGPPTPYLWVAEGLESSLSVLAALHHGGIAGESVWSCLSLGNFGAPLPAGVERVTLCVDADERQPLRAERTKAAAARAHAAAGRRVFFARPPAGTDFNDLLMAGAA